MTPAKNGTGRPEFAVGDRVRVVGRVTSNYYHAIVTRIGSGVIFAQIDGEQHSYWYSPGRIELLDAVSRLGDLV